MPFGFVLTFPIFFPISSSNTDSSNTSYTFPFQTTNGYAQLRATTADEEIKNSNTSNNAVFFIIIPSNKKGITTFLYILFLHLVKLSSNLKKVIYSFTK